MSDGKKLLTGETVCYMTLQFLPSVVCYHKIIIYFYKNNLIYINIRIALKITVVNMLI